MAATIRRLPSVSLTKDAEHSIAEISGRLGIQDGSDLIDLSIKALELMAGVAGPDGMVTLTGSDGKTVHVKVTK